MKALCQLSDRYRYSACTEVVALLDQAADFFSAEQSLDLALGRRISLLYLCAAHFDGSLRMYL